MYSTDSTPWQALAREAAPGDDAAGARLWPLPELKPFTRPQLERWFSRVKVIDDPVQRAALADLLLTNEEGEPDAVPANVLRRLHNEIEAGTIPMQEKR